MATMASLLCTVAKRVLLPVCLAFVACGCGGGGNDETGVVARASDATQLPSSSALVVPFKASFRGKTYVEWEVAFWQWALSLPVNSTLRHPFSDCESRPISSWQTGIVWFWTAPDSPSMTCDQQRTIIPAGTAIFLSLLGIEASSLEAPPFLAESATEQKQIATSYGSKISNVFCTIDDVKVQNIATYRTTTGQFTFLAPSPWAYGEKGGQGTAVADGYFLLLKPLSPGAHKIHYGGVFHTPVGELPKDITLLITVGANR